MRADEAVEAGFGCFVIEAGFGDDVTDGDAASARNHRSPDDI